MKGFELPEENRIRPEMTILDIVELCPQTEAVFKKYDSKAGVCLCCQALFESLHETAKKYGLNLERLLKDLNAALPLTKEEFAAKDSLPADRIEMPGFDWKA